MKKLCALGLVLGMVFGARVVYGEELTSTERMVRLETKIDEGFKAVNQRIDDTNQRINGMDASLNKRIDDIWNLLLWGFGILFAGMFSLVGFVLWDRRTALAPAVREVKEVARQEGLIIETLRRFAQDEPKMAQAIKSAGLL